MDRAELTRWLEEYERGWRTPGTEALDELFTVDATYSTAPYENGQRGLAAIGEMCEAERLGPDEEFEMSSEVVAVEGDTGVARGRGPLSGAEEQGVPRPVDRPPERRGALLPLRGVALLAPRPEGAAAAGAV
jgi:hypothetical protein